MRAVDAAVRVFLSLEAVLAQPVLHCIAGVFGMRVKREQLTSCGMQFGADLFIGICNLILVNAAEQVTLFVCDASKVKVRSFTDAKSAVFCVMSFSAISWVGG
jgi:hypothetical protein